jgi:hypothetical protein
MGEEVVALLREDRRRRLITIFLVLRLLLLGFGNW